MKIDCLLDILEEKEYINDIITHTTKENNKLMYISCYTESEDVIDKICDTCTEDGDIIVSSYENNHLIIMFINKFLESWTKQALETCYENIDAIRECNYKISTTFPFIVNRGILTGINEYQNDYKFIINKNEYSEKERIIVKLLNIEREYYLDKKARLKEMKDFCNSLP